MATKIRLQAFAVVSIVMLVCAFAFVDFTVGEHHTEVRQQVATSSTNGASMTVPTTVFLYVVGPDPYRTQIEDELVDGFDERGVDALVVTDLEPEYDQPVLLVAVRESRLSYNPVSPSASVSLGFEYAADGNVTQFGQEVRDAGFDAALVDERLLSDEDIPIVLDDQNTLFRSGNINFTDTTTGINSWPGYRTYVLDSVAENGIAALLNIE
jgi:hypothetical protein